MRGALRPELVERIRVSGAQLAEQLAAQLAEQLPPEPPEQVHVVGWRFDRAGWKVALFADGAAVAALPPEAARVLAREILEMTELCDGKIW